VLNQTTLFLQVQQDNAGKCEILVSQRGETKYLGIVYCDAVPMGEKFRPFQTEKFAFLLKGLFVSEDPEDESTKIILKCINTNTVTKMSVPEIAYRPSGRFTSPCVSTLLR